MQDWRKEKLAERKGDILNLFDFFMGLDMYTKEDRDFIIDNNKIYQYCSEIYSGRNGEAG